MQLACRHSTISLDAKGIIIGCTLSSSTGNDLRHKLEEKLRMGEYPGPLFLSAHLVATANRNPEAVSKGCYLRIKRLPIETTGADKLFRRKPAAKVDPAGK
jgi:hypothetical protein